jgi:hypothetical protein
LSEVQAYKSRKAKKVANPLSKGGKVEAESGGDDMIRRRMRSFASIAPIRSLQITSSKDECVGRVLICALRITCEERGYFVISMFEEKQW